MINKTATNIIKDLKKCETNYLNNISKNIKKEDIEIFIKLYKEIGNNIINRKEDINE